MSSTIDSKNVRPARKGLGSSHATVQGAQSARQSNSEPRPPPQPSSLEEFRRSEGRENRKQRLLALWNRLPPLPQPKQRPSNDKTPKPLGPDGLTYEKAESLRAMYDRELLVNCKGPKDGGSAQRIGWEEFKEYAKAKEAGTLSIYFFHSITLFNFCVR